jgi:hypothetical protein
MIDPDPSPHPLPREVARGATRSLDERPMAHGMIPPMTPMLVGKQGHDPIGIADVGAATALLCSPFARRLSGGTFYVDGGHHILG